MSLRVKPTATSGFKEIFVTQNNDNSMSFIFMVKSATYEPQTNEQILGTLQKLDRESFTQLESLWVPAFTCEVTSTSVPELVGLQLDKSDPSETTVGQVHQSCRIELFCLP